MFADAESTFVAGCHWYGIRVAGSGQSLAATVTVTMDGRFEWAFELSAWRPLSFGAGSDAAYLWSARDLIVLPQAEDDEPVVLTVDEDVLFAFRVDNGWVLVCESSVRRILSEQQTARWELPDVVLHAFWRGGLLILRDESGGETQLRANGPDLILESA